MTEEYGSITVAGLISRSKNGGAGTEIMTVMATMALSTDSGQYVILSAQYGTSRRHVDVTNRLKELARQDRAFRMGNSTFGIDPDQGQQKTLRIYARGPDGQDRMFEYREGSTVDGAQFRSWGGGDWGNSGWNGGWEGGGSGSGYEAQPEMAAAVQHLREAQRSLELASRDKGGHRSAGPAAHQPGHRGSRCGNSIRQDPLIEVTSSLVWRGGPSSGSRDA